MYSPHMEPSTVAEVSSSPSKQLALANSTGSSALVASGGDLPQYGELVAKLDVAFRRQHDINQANAKLNFANYVANVANVVRNRQLQQMLVDGRKKITQLEVDMQRQVTTIAKLEDDISSLDVEMGEQKEEAQRLKIALEDNQVKLEASMAQHKLELEKQNALIEEQQRLTQGLIQTKFNQDRILDAGLIVVCLWIVNMSIIDYPLSWATSITPGSKQRKNFVHQSFKLGLVVAMYFYSRQQAKQFGLHNSVGSWVQYGLQLWSGTTENLVPALTSAVNSAVPAITLAVNTAVPTLTSAVNAATTTVSATVSAYASK